MNSNILKMIREVEFSNDVTKLLHKNPTENGLTYYGIYESAHPTWKGWFIVKSYLEVEPELKKCSKILSNVSNLNRMVEDFYKKEFFDKMKLDLVKSEHKQLEIMCFAINVGIVPTVKVLQRLLNVTVDGLIGQQTIKALNAFDEELFDKLFDIAEIEYYDKLVTNKERFKIYQKGWHNRANVI